MNGANEVAHHEAAHALMARHLGHRIKRIYIADGDLITEGRVVYADRGWLWADIIKTSQAGPLASARYLGCAADDDGLLDWLHNITTWQHERFQFINDIRLNQKIDSQNILITRDDYSMVFDRLLRIHYHLTESILTDKNIIRLYREYEEGVSLWLDAKWSKIEKLASAILVHRDMNETDFEAVCRGNGDECDRMPKWPFT